MNTGDTIAAISSAVGPATRMIVRASGPGVRALYQRLTGDEAFHPGARFRSIQLGGLSLAAWVYAFLSPHSATGEDLVELHLPGNPLLARLAVEQLIRHGARPAEPGEFTARAYFNGKMTLAQAEAVAATIAAHSDRELAAARQLAAGELSRQLQPVMDLAAETLALVEVAIDFAEEDVSFLSDEELLHRVGRLEAMLSDLLEGSARFERLSHEPHIVLVGRPNAGKSTLLNALAGHDRAVVSPQPGTTRDVIWAPIELRRGTVRVIDVAGMDDAGADSIARQMQAQALDAVEQADIVVSVRASDDERCELLLSRPPHLRVATKSDLRSTAGEGELSVCAPLGSNLDRLRDRLDELAFGGTVGGERLALNARHVRAIGEARGALRRAAAGVRTAGGEVIALELRDALDSLGQVLGHVTPDDLLGRIFSTFCIGK